MIADKKCIKAGGLRSFLQSSAHGFESFQAIVTTDVQVRHKTHLLGVNSRSQYAFCAETLAELSGIHAGPADIEDQNIADHFSGIDLDSWNLGESLSEDLRIVMVFFEACRHL